MDEMQTPLAAGALAAQPEDRFLPQQQIEKEPAKPSIVTQNFPPLTIAVMLTLTAIFLLEIEFPSAPETSPLSPAPFTLLTFGGLSRMAVLLGGQWFRLLSQPLLHASIAHLLSNLFGLYIAGRILEPMIGRGWLLGVLLISAWSGSIVSLFTMPENLIGIGASGAIMGLFGLMCVMAYRVPNGPGRVLLLRYAVGTLIPSLSFFQPSSTGMLIDYGAHAGGAVAGIAVGFGLLRAWKAETARPPLAKEMLVIGLAGSVSAFLASGYAFAHGNEALQASLCSDLIPQEMLKKSDAEVLAQVESFRQNYPHDPRTEWFHAILLDQQQHYDEARSSLQIALAEPKLKYCFTPAFRQRLDDLAAQINSHQMPLAGSGDRPAIPYNAPPKPGTQTNGFH